MSTKIINKNSNLIAQSKRNQGEKIEDRLLREGKYMQQKKEKLQEEFYRSEVSVKTAQSTKRTDYKKILYPTPKVRDELEFDLDLISQISSRQEVISKMFRQMGRR